MSKTTNTDNAYTEELKEVPLDKPPSEKSPVYSAFSTSRKALIVSIVTLAGFLGPASGNIYIPVLPLLRESFKTSSFAINGTVSVFMLIFAIAPIIWANWADYGGRKILYLCSLALFIVASLLLATVPANIGALYILRVLQAFGASSVMSLGVGTVADITEPKNRGKVISYFMLGPQLGPIIGPLLSAIASDGEWRWLFGFLTIFGFLVYLMVLFLLPETLRCLVGNAKCYEDKTWFLIPQLKQEKIIDNEEDYPSPPKPTLKRMLKALTFAPVVLCSLSGGFLFAGFYAMVVTFADILHDQHNFSQLQVSVAYLSPGVSLVVGSLSGGWLSDRLRRASGKGIPEHRLWLQLVGLAFATLGLLGYGWSIDKSLRLVSVFIFSFISGCGMTWVFVISTTYLSECSMKNTATNVALGNMVRNLAAAISSLIIEKMVRQIGYGWCFTELALLNVISVAIVLLLIRYGPSWRASSKY